MSRDCPHPPIAGKVDPLAARLTVAVDRAAPPCDLLRVLARVLRQLRDGERAAPPVGGKRPAGEQ